MCVKVCRCVGACVCVCACYCQRQGGVDRTEGQEGGRRRETEKGATTSESYRGIS